MSKLPRPHIPLDVRCRVALRQLGYVQQVIDYHITVQKGAYEYFLCNVLLPVLAEQKLGCTVEQLHLDHDPALENRVKIYRPTHGGLKHYEYSPKANSPDHLRYIVGGKSGDGSQHDVKTRVRGEHGQLSDHGIARKEKRRQRKLTGKKRTHKWAKGRKLQSRNNLRRRK